MNAIALSKINQVTFNQLTERTPQKVTQKSNKFIQKFIQKLWLKCPNVVLHIKADSVKLRHN